MEEGRMGVAKEGKMGGWKESRIKEGDRRRKEREHARN